MIGQLLAKRYLILEQLGAGGFSETYLARDKYLPHHPLCVVKCLKLSSDSVLSPETAQALFETEARILDRLGRQSHQIPVLLAYCQEQVYQIQEYIEGEKLGDWLVQGRGFGSREAIDLLMEVLPVLDYIHSQKIIHRDITPNNLICRPDGQVVLIDFGAACLLEDETDSEQGVVLAIGTPGYMPAEQAAGVSQFNSDLYALGMSVIHLLTRVEPQQIQIDPISGELEWQHYLGDQAIEPLVLTVLERMVRTRSRDRYQTANEVLAALKSRPKRWFPQIAKISPIQQISRSAVALLLVGTLARASTDLHQPLASSSLLSPNADVHLTLLRDLPLQADIEQMLITPDDRTLVTAEASHTLRLWTLPEGARRHSMVGHTDKVTALEISNDSRLLVSGSADQTVRLWDTELGVRMRTFVGNQAPVTAVAISPDTRTIASGSQDGVLRVWDSQTGQLLRSLKIPEAEITAVAFDATSSRLISASSDRQIEVWDLETGQLQRRFVGHTDRIVGLKVRDDQRLFSFGKDRTLVWDLDREELVHALSEESAKPITALVDRDYITTVHNDGNIHIWTCKTGRLAMTISGLGDHLNARLSPDRQYLVSWSPTQPLQVWRLGAAP